jgi:hypothetical protein
MTQFYQLRHNGTATRCCHNYRTPDYRLSDDTDMNVESNILPLEVASDNKKAKVNKGITLRMPEQQLESS